MGLPFLRRRKSSYIHGAEDDARFLSRHLYEFLNMQKHSSMQMNYATVDVGRAM